MTEMQFAIETNEVVKRYGNIAAVDKISLKIEYGEIFGLLGPNGAGKTTLLLMFATLRKPTSGSVTVNGYDVKRSAGKVRKSIGMVFQEPSTDDILTGYENLKLHSLMYGVPKKAIEDRIEEVLRIVDLKNRSNDLVKKYSGGMRRRLEIARGLIHKPKILLLDEPTIGLDPQTREHIWHYIEALAREEKITIVITTHYMDEAERLCDRVAIVDFGKIIALDTPKHLEAGLGGDLVSLKAKAPDVERIKKLEFVKRVEEREGRLVLTVTNANEHLQEILQVAGKVEAVEMKSPNLNDVFLKYTGRSIREGGDVEGGFMERMAKWSK
jgi:ABC-2 type transport system ATP-binding protein